MKSKKTNGKQGVKFGLTDVTWNNINSYFSVLKLTDVYFLAINGVINPINGAISLKNNK